jgi:predicted NBD/HSP70 family sugar kinase
MISSHIGELAMGRAAVLLGQKSAMQFCSIGNHPDEAGLLGVVQLAPAWVLEGHDAVLAADIGGTNIRVGLIGFKLKNKEVAKTEVVKLIHWRYVDEKPGRDEAVERLAHMLKDLVGTVQAEKLKLAPFVGVACPGLIDGHGTIVRGGQNLPGNWEGQGFNLPQEITTRLGSLSGHEPVVVMHNDAVVQGLSEVPNMEDVSHWGVLTIGTGLGNAHFTNRRVGKDG